MVLRAWGTRDNTPFSPVPPRAANQGQWSTPLYAEVCTLPIVFRLAARARSLAHVPPYMNEWPLESVERQGPFSQHFRLLLYFSAARYKECQYNTSSHKAEWVHTPFAATSRVCPVCQQRSYWVILP